MAELFHVLDIIRGTTVDGPGFRTAIYLAGCSHQCRDCHNPQSWKEENGIPMSLEEIMQIVGEEDFDVTLSGGDPLFNPSLTRKLMEALKNNGRNIWLYTGYTWEELLHNQELLKAATLADVVVDGPFITELKDLDLLFRGSANQRLIDVARSLEQKSIVLYKQ